MSDRILIYAKEVLLHADLRASMGEKRTYIICGRTGPTGKTWLWNELRRAGHNAIEISEGLNGFVDYHDNKNHMLECCFGCIIVILNKPLDEAWKT